MASADFTTSASFPAQSTQASSTLHGNLARLAARRNSITLWQHVAGAAACGLGIALLPILAYRFYLVDGPVWIPAIPILLSLLIGWRSGVLARADLFQAALEADEKLGLKERLSSALAFARPELALRNKSYAVAPTTLVPSLVDDAATHSQSLQPKEIYPLRFDRTHRVLALTLALFVVAAFMPNVPWLLAKEEQKQRGVIAQQGEELIEVSKEIKKDEPKETPQSAQAQQLARRMENLGQKMLRGRMGKKEALTSLGELKKDLEKATKNDGQNQNSGSDIQNIEAALKQLADQPMGSASGRKLAEEAKKGDAQAAAKEMEKLADKIEKGELSEAEKQKTASDMKKMADALKKQGGEQNQQMAEQLEQAAKSLEGQKPNQQQNQQGQNQQGQSGQNQQGQSQQGQNQKGQNGGQQQNQQGGNQGASQNGNQGASNALRQAAKSLQKGGSPSNSQQLQKMLDKIREAEKNTGTGGQQGQSGAGQPGMSPGQGQGQGKNGQGPGGQNKDLKPTDPKGLSGGGAGLGPRNNSKGIQSGGGVSDQKSKRSGDKRRWEDVWSDRVPPTRKKIDRVQGKYSDDGEMEQLPTKTEAKGGPVKTPYYEVYESYQKDAQDAISKETVPPAYKQPVKNYFESIKPQ